MIITRHACDHCKKEIEESVSFDIYIGAESDGIDTVYQYANIDLCAHCTSELLQNITRDKRNQDFATALSNATRALINT